DAPDPIARLPRAEVRELDPLAPGARHLVAGEDLRFERRHEGAERLLARIDAQPLRFSQAGLPRPESEDVAGPDEQGPDRRRTPPSAAELQLDRSLLVRTQVDRTGRAVFGRQLLRRR